MKLTTNSPLVLLAVILTFIFSSVGAAQSERRVMPIDEGKKDASFVAFREKFIAAVKRRDVKFLLDTLDPDIKGSFGGHSGIADFKELWKLDREPEKSEVWEELSAVLTNGGTFVKSSQTREFCAPYSFTSFPEDVDGFEHQIVFGNNVNLRAEPNTKAQTVAQLSYNIIKVDYDNSVADTTKEGEYLWLKIETLGGKKGFVNAQFVRSPIDYRACFEKRGGKWKMSFFLAGD